VQATHPPDTDDPNSDTPVLSRLRALVLHSSLLCDALDAKQRSRRTRV
jgi:hypothetical protein